MAGDLWGLSYRIFGKLTNRVVDYFSDLESSILKSGIKVALESYISLLFLITSLSFITSFTILMYYLLMISNITFVFSVIIAFAASILMSSFVFVLIYSFPSLKASFLAGRIEEELPFAVAHMNVLALGGMTPEEIFRAIASVDDAVGNFMKDLVRDIDVLGLDLPTALARARERAPSKSLESFLAEAEAVVVSGGNISDFLQSYAHELLSTQTIQTKEFSETLGTLAEVFIILMVVFPLLMIVMLSIMSIIGGNIMGLSLSTLMMIITYVVVPALGFIFLILLDQLMPRGE